MYLEQVPEKPFTTTLMKIKYDCCGKEHILKWVDANKNFNHPNHSGRHMCRTCWLRSPDNPAKKKENIEKAKQTNLGRYGTTVAMNQPHLIKERSDKFNNNEFLAQWNEKHKQTCLERYGVEHPMHLEEVKEKQRETLMEHWGVGIPLRSEEILEKRRQTLLQKNERRKVIPLLISTITVDYQI